MRIDGAFEFKFFPLLVIGNLRWRWVVGSVNRGGWRVPRGGDGCI